MNDSKSPDKRIQSFLDLRDQLVDYLDVLEKNTDAVNDWLLSNKKKIILSHRKLERALAEKNETKALGLLAAMGDITGFVLNLQDFRKKAEAVFGKDSAFQKAVEKTPDIFPPSLHETVPKVSLPDDFAAVGEALPPGAEQEEKGMWASLADMFNKEQRQKEEEDRAFQRRLREMKTDILNIPSERHYYIDGVMNWIGDGLAPETADGIDAKTKMLQHKDPAHVIRLAEEDYKDAVETKVNALKAEALEYSALAAAIDSQDINGIVAALPIAYPEKETRESVFFRKTLLEDYSAVSLAEIIMKDIKNRQDQEKLLLSPFPERDEKAFSFAASFGRDGVSVTNIFEKFFTDATKSDNPVSMNVLSHVIEVLSRKYLKTPSDFAFTGGQNIFQRLETRFAGDYAAQKNAFSAVLSAMKMQTPGIENEYIDLCKNLDNNDSYGLLGAFKKIGENGSSKEIYAFWNLCRPGGSLFEKIRGVSADPATKAALLDQALQTGLLEFSNEKLISVMETDVLSSLPQFPVSTVRNLLAAGISGEKDRNAIRSRMIGLLSNGWLEKIISSEMDGQKKAEWISALLHPFGSDIVRANILAAASWHTKAEGPENAKILSLMERNLIGENIRLSEDVVLCNMNRILNVWYNESTNTLLYMAGGVPHTLLPNVAPSMAEEILSLIQRRIGFMEGKNGVFIPETADSIHYGEESSASWNRVVTPVFIGDGSRTEILKRKDFIHVTDENGFPLDSYNIASICLLQEMDDGSTLLIDKHGEKHILTGTITLPANGDLIEMSNRIKFNPENASILRLNKNDSTLEFRIETPAFEKLLSDDDRFFYSLKVAGNPVISALEKRMKKLKDIHALKGNNVDGLYFNMKTLGYLVEDESLSGFHCKGGDPLRRTWFIPIDSGTDMASEILDSLRGKDGIVAIGNALMHADSIDNAYFDPAKKTLQIISGRNIQKISAEQVDGFNALHQIIGQNNNFTVVASDGVPLVFRDVTDMPSDILHLGRVTLVYSNTAQGTAYAITESTPFDLALKKADIPAFLDNVEKRNSDLLKKEAAAHGWTQNLDSTLSVLQKPTVFPSASAEKKTPETLLKQILNAIAPEKKASPKKTTTPPKGFCR